MKTVLLLFAVLCSVGCAEKQKANEGRRVEITVTGDGYHPAGMAAQPGEKLVLVFKPSGFMGCCNKIVIAGATEAVTVPRDKPIEVAVTMPPSGPLGFACTMNMCKGSIGLPAANHDAN